jgi:hypothetical protein
MVVICDVIKRIFENIKFYWFERKKKLYEENQIINLNIPK